MLQGATYVGPELQFSGRHAVVQLDDLGIITAQFDSGKLWETHSQLHFELKDWKLDDESEGS